MRKSIILIISILLSFSSVLMAEELCLISVKANGVETNYAISTVQNITIDTQSAEAPSFVINSKDGKHDGGAKLIKFGEFIPTNAQESEVAPIKVNVYSKEHTIYVESEEDCNIYFFNLAGQQLGDCVKASYCECTISLSGSYIVIAGGQQFKIQVQ